MPEPLSLLVRNLPYNASKDELFDLFSKYGRVTDVHLPVDHLTREMKGFGFVQFSDAEEAAEAIKEKNNTSYHGRTISVLVAQAQRKRPDEMAQIDPRGASRGSRRSASPRDRPCSSGDRSRDRYESSSRRRRDDSADRGRSRRRDRSYSEDRGRRRRGESESDEGRDRRRRRGAYDDDEEDDRKSRGRRRRPSPSSRSRSRSLSS